MKSSKVENSQLVPLFSTPIKAGFPSPAEEYIDSFLDLNKYVIDNPPATFFLKVAGDSMSGAGIFEGDILVVDKSIQPKDNDIIVSLLEGEFNVKRYARKGNTVILSSENKLYKPRVITPETEFEVWGVVTFVVSKKR